MHQGKLRSQDALRRTQLLTILSIVGFTLVGSVSPQGVVAAADEDLLSVTWEIPPFVVTEEPFTVELTVAVRKDLLTVGISVDPGTFRVLDPGGLELIAGKLITVVADVPQGRTLTYRLTLVCPLSGDRIEVKVSALTPAGETTSQTLSGFVACGVFTPPPSPPRTLRDLDRDKDCFLNDSEFFGAIDLWVAQVIDDRLFFATIDAWVGRTNVCMAAASTSEARQPLKLESVVPLPSSSGDGVTFVVRGQGMAVLEVEIYALDGRRIFRGETVGSRLRWGLRTNDGRPVAYGVYLYGVTVRSLDGREVRSTVKKLVVLRRWR